MGLAILSVRAGVPSLRRGGISQNLVQEWAWLAGFSVEVGGISRSFYSVGGIRQSSLCVGFCQNNYGD